MAILVNADVRVCRVSPTSNERTNAETTFSYSFISEWSDTYVRSTLYLQFSVNIRFARENLGHLYVYSHFQCSRANSV